MEKHHFWKTGLIIALCLTSANSRPIPALDLDVLSNEADLIAVGRVTNLREVGRESIVVGSSTVLARIRVGEIQADSVLKGNHLMRIPFKYWVPDTQIGYRGVDPATTRLFFLRQAEHGYRFASPYYPSVVAITGIPNRGETPIERVVNQVAGVLLSPSIRPEVRVQAVYVLSRTKHPSAADALKQALTDQEQTVGLSASAALLERNDLSGLQIAADALLSAGTTVPDHILHNMTYALSEGVYDEKAIPTLTRLLTAPDPRVRRASASALRRTRSQKAIPPLLSALEDSDVQVRYYAVVGLAEITGQTERRPNLDDFVADEKPFMNFWTSWRDARKLHRF
jgi:hypothetical protein